MSLSNFLLYTPEFFKNNKVRGWPGGIVVKFAHSATVVQGSPLQILDTDLHTTHQAMLWWHPAYKIEEDWQQILVQRQSSSPKKKEERERNY